MLRQAFRAAPRTYRGLRLTSPSSRVRAQSNGCFADESAAYPRDLLGYGDKPPDAQWPGGAKVALNLVLNYEEVLAHALPKENG